MAHCSDEWGRVIGGPPSLDFALGVVEAKESIDVQTLLPQPSVEESDFGVVGRLAGPAEVHLDVPFVGAAVHHLADELSAVICLDHGRQTALRHDRVEGSDHVFFLQALPDVDRQALARLVVDHRQHAQLPASNSASATKPMLQISLMAVTNCLGCRHRAALLCRSASDAGIALPRGRADTHA